jgi:UDP-2,4-diacetamido-2,4,6-trideoxy-beta-L-altropyranose hydrolase
MDCMVSTSLVIAFRVDAAPHIGSGHLMRCVTLADALKTFGCETHFLGRPPPAALRTLVESNGHCWHDIVPAGVSPAEAGAPAHAAWLGATQAADAAATAAALATVATVRPDWLVVDHYALDERWERQVRALVGRILVIDDLADRPHDADLLVDQNLQSGPARYAGLLPAHCRSLLGPRYALLRPEFVRLRAAAERQADRGLRNLLAFAGSYDSTDLLPRVARAWARLSGRQRPRLDMVVGQDSPNLARLRDLESRADGLTLHVQTTEMAELIAATDLMLAAGGSINWERCCLGVPALVCETAANQHENVRELARARTAIALGPSESLDVTSLTDLLGRLVTRPSLLRRLGERASRLVDGEGARRVVMGMLAYCVALRRATAADAEPAWAWRNAASTRRYFTDPSPIRLRDHLGWWQSTLARPDRTLLVAEVKGEAVGVLRLDREGDDATVSIYLDPKLTGVGLGTPLLNAAKAWAGAESAPVRRLVAVIHRCNRASVGAFSAAGFRAVGEKWICEI